MASSPFQPSTVPLVLPGVPLAERTTLRVGGPAAFFAEYRDPGELVELWRWAIARQLPLIPLGQGSNVLVDDAGVEALVVQSTDRRLHADRSGRRPQLVVGGGAGWEDVVDLCNDRDWHGLECMAGIPGLMGAAPVQNIGAYGQELADVFVSLEALDTTSGELVRFDKVACGFRYRSSRFKRFRGRYVITEVTLALESGGRPERQYPDLVRALGADLSAYSLPEISDAVRRIRAAKGMLVRADDPDSRSAGSFFTNPVLDEEHVAAFFDRCRSRGLAVADVPTWPVGDGEVKIAAAWLIEQSGFTKGHRHGGAGISRKHPLALVNRDGATAAEVRELAERIQAGVASTFGVHLEPEPVFLGG